MVAGNVLIATGCIAAFCAGFFLCSTLVQTLGGQARLWRVQQHAGSFGLSHITQIKVPGFINLANKLLAISAVRSFAQQLCLAARQQGIAIAENRALSWLLVCCAAVLLGCIGVGRWALGVVGVAVLVFASGAYSSRILEARAQRMRKDLPEAISAMAACFGVGFSLLQTFAHLEKEIRGPLGSLFGLAARAMQAGTSPVAALRSIQQEGHMAELSFIAVALAVQHQTGGSMQSVLEATRASLAEELELKRSLQVHTAQAKLSACVVIGVTIGLVAMLLLVSKDFLQPFFASALGMALLGLAIAMQVLGVLFIRRLLQVDMG